MVGKIEVLEKYLEFRTDMNNEEFSDWMAELAQKFADYHESP